MMITIIKKIINYICNEEYRFCVKARHGKLNNISDEDFLKELYRIRMGRCLNLDNPKRLTEKMQWLKCYNHDPLLVKMVDKLEVRKIVKDLIGPNHVVPVLGVWNRAEEITRETIEHLPDKFVLKCTHDSGSVIICRNKDTFNLQDARLKLSDSLKHNHYFGGREWPYKDVPHKIIAEGLLENNDKSRLVEYDVFCFNGKAEFVSVCYGDRDKNEERYNDMYSVDGKKLPFTWGYPSSNKTLHLDNKFYEAIEYSEKLSQGLAFVRVDFYLCNNQLYFSEFTFFHWSGMKKFEPEMYDLIMGEKLPLNLK